MQLTGYIFVRESGLKLVERYGRKEFAYIEVLWNRSISGAAAEAEKPWTCEICGKGADAEGFAQCDGHIGEGFQ